MVKKIVLWVLVIACMATIFSFSGQDSGSSQDLSDGLLMKILNFLNLDLEEGTVGFLSVFIRKAAHFTIYAILGALICILMKSGYDMKGKKCFFIPALVSGLYAFTDEFHQLFISGRSGQLTDVLLDFAGAVMGVTVVMLVFTLTKRRKKNG